jgi:predicted dienelactone hydrolase
MRPFEIALLVASIPLLLRYFLPIHIRNRPRWIGLMLALSALLTAAHLVFEGYRRQMLPAYTLTGLLLVLTALQVFRSATQQTNRRLLSIIAKGLGLLLLAIAFVLPLLFPIFRFPRPSGPHQVGTLTYHWVDAAREETFTDDQADHRELMVQIWYPAEPVSGARPGPYVAHPREIGTALAEVLLGLPPFVFSHLKYIRTNSVPDAPVSTAQSRYPVILFSHGRGGVRIQNTFQVEELVSHGYVVVGIDHTYAAVTTVFPDGRVVSIDPRLKDTEFLKTKFEVLANDARFVVDQLEMLNADDPGGMFLERLDLTRVGIFGHSLGGVVAAEACRLDARFEAGIALDVFVPQKVVENGLAQPFMFITRDTATMEQELTGLDPGERQALVDGQMDSIQAVFDEPGKERYLVKIHGLFHYNATDLPLWSPLTPVIGLAGPIDTSRAHRIINVYTLAFFDRHLDGQPALLLEGPSPDYPEVEFSVHHLQSSADHPRWVMTHLGFAPVPRVDAIGKQ